MLELLTHKNGKWLKKYYIGLLCLVLLAGGFWVGYLRTGEQKTSVYSALKPINIFSGYATGGIKQPTGVAVGPKKQLYIIDSGNKKITVLHPDGRYAFSFGSPGSGRAELDKPVSIDVGRDGRVYVVDKTKEAVVVFESNGTYITTIDKKPSGSFRPSSIAVDQKGQLIAFDASAGKFFLYKPTEKKWVGILRKPADGSGSFTGMEIAPEQSWALGVNSEQPGYSRVSTYRSDIYGSECVINPQGITYLPSKKQVLVSDSSDNTIVVFSDRGKYLGEFGGTGSDMNQFQFPAGVAWDGQDRLYVADKYNNRIVVYGE